MARWVKSILCEPEDQCSDSQHPTVSWRLWLVPVTLVLVTQGQEDPGIFLMVTQFNYNREPQAQ